MNLVHLLPVGTIAASELERLRAAIPERLPVRCEILPLTLDPTASYHAERQQFHSSEILQQMQNLVRPTDWRVLAVTDVDLYIPILKYVFGEAQMGGPCAVVSVFAASVMVMSNSLNCRSNCRPRGRTCPSTMPAFS